MARISFKELVDLIKRDSGYQNKWEMEVPAEQALYIQFGDKSSDRKVNSQVFEIVGGLELVVDRDDSGKVVGIEVV